MQITFCDFNYDGAYEYTLTCGLTHQSGNHWDLMRDGGWYMGCFVRYGDIWEFTGNSKGKIHPMLETYMISRIIDYKDAKVKESKPKWAQ